jgi:hypothetical protein
MYDILFKMIFERIRWTGHVAYMGGRGMHTRFWWESQIKGDN